MKINEQNLPELTEEKMEKIVGGISAVIDKSQKTTAIPDSPIVYELAVAIRIAKSQGMSKEDFTQQWNSTHTGAAVAAEVQYMIDQLWSTL